MMKKGRWAAQEDIIQREEALRRSNPPHTAAAALGSNVKYLPISKLNGKYQLTLTIKVN